MSPPFDFRKFTSFTACKEKVNESMLTTLFTEPRRSTTLQNFKGRGVRFVNVSKVPELL